MQIVGKYEQAEDCSRHKQTDLEPLYPAAPLESRRLERTEEHE